MGQKPNWTHEQAVVAIREHQQFVTLNGILPSSNDLENITSLNRDAGGFYTFFSRLNLAIQGMCYFSDKNNVDRNNMLRAAAAKCGIPLSGQNGKIYLPILEWEVLSPSDRHGPTHKRTTNVGNHDANNLQIQLPAALPAAPSYDDVIAALKTLNPTVAENIYADWASNNGRGRITWAAMRRYISGYSKRIKPYEKFTQDCGSLIISLVSEL